MAYDVLEVCRYVIKYSNEKGYGVSNLKLQKLLYFIQAYFLITKGEPCFNEAIEAWEFGPVVPEAYREYKQYGSTNIPTMDTFLKIDKTNYWNTTVEKYPPITIDENSQYCINIVVDKFSPYPAIALIELTHDQAPWKSVYEPGMNNEISIDSIREYFNAKQ